MHSLGLYDYHHDDGRQLSLEVKIKPVLFLQSPALVLTLADFSVHKHTIEEELNATFNRLLERCFKNELRPQLNGKAKSELAANLYFLKGYLPRNLETHYSDTHMSLLLVYYSLYDIQDLLDSRHKREFNARFTKAKLQDEATKCAEIMTFLSARRNVTIQLHFDTTLPIKVKLDRIRLRQLLVGAMKQAVTTCKYGAHVHVSLTLYSAAQQIREVMIHVTPIKPDDSLLMQSLSLLASELGSTGLQWGDRELSFTMYAPAAIKKSENVRVDVADVSLEEA